MLIKRVELTAGEGRARIAVIILTGLILLAASAEAFAGEAGPWSWKRVQALVILAMVVGTVLKRPFGPAALILLAVVKTGITLANAANINGSFLEGTLAGTLVQVLLGAYLLRAFLRRSPQPSPDRPEVISLVRERSS